MSEYIHPDEFDFLLQTTPYKIWIWLQKETKYKISKMGFGEVNPLLPPPHVSNRVDPKLEGEITVFRLQEGSVTPLPSDSHALFILVAKTLFFDSDDLDNKSYNEGIGEYETIRIDLEKVGVNVTQVTGDYSSRYRKLDRYMNRIIEQITKKFQVVGRDKIPEKLPLKSGKASKYYIPQKEKTLERWKEAYEKIDELCRIYKENFLDGQSDDPAPSIDDIREHLKNEMDITRSDRWVRQVIEWGERGMPES